MVTRIARILLWLAIIGGVATGGWYYYQQSHASTKKSGPKVRTSKVARSEFRLVVSTTGVVEPKDTVEIRSKASGEIKSLHFEEGDTVTKGQLLIQLDTTLEQRRVNQAKADLAIARANYLKAVQVWRHARSKYNIENRLYKKKLVTEESVVNLKHDVAVKHAELAVASAQVKKAAEALKEADDRFADTRIAAPSDGVVLYRYVQPGQIIFSGINSSSGGTLLAKMANLSQLYVRVDVDEADVAHLRKKLTATITVDALPRESFTGTIIRVNPEGKTENNVTVFVVIVKLEPRAAKMLKVRMTANVKIEVQRMENVITVPSVAVRYRRGKPGVYVMKERPRFKPVALGLTNGSTTVVTDGLTEGETIVVSKLEPRKRGGSWRSSMFSRGKKK